MGSWSNGKADCSGMMGCFVTFSHEHFLNGAAIANTVSYIKDRVIPGLLNVFKFVTH